MNINSTYTPPTTDSTKTPIQQQSTVVNSSTQCFKRSASRAELEEINTNRKIIEFLNQKLWEKDQYLYEKDNDLYEKDNAINDLQNRISYTENTLLSYQQKDEQIQCLQEKVFELQHQENNDIDYINKLENQVYELKTQVNNCFNYINSLENELDKSKKELATLNEKDEEIKKLREVLHQKNEYINQISQPLLNNHQPPVPDLGRMGLISRSNNPAVITRFNEAFSSETLSNDDVTKLMLEERRILEEEKDKPEKKKPKTKRSKTPKNLKFNPALTESVTINFDPK